MEYLQTFHSFPPFRWSNYIYTVYTPEFMGKTISVPEMPLFFGFFFVNWCGKNQPEKHRRPVGIRRVPKANEGLFQDLKSANSKKEVKKSTVKKVSEMPKVSHVSLVMRLIESPVLRNKEVSYPALLRAAKEAARWDSGLAFSSRGPTTKHCGWKKKRSNVTLW